MQIVMDNAKIGVQNMPNGFRNLVVTDAKSGLAVIVPLPPEAAKTVGAALYSTLAVATLPLPTGNGGEKVQ